MTAKKYLEKLGREGGKLAASRMTPEQRQERARKAALARWGKKHGAGGPL
jgi:hypothetical protein